MHLDIEFVAGDLSLNRMMTDLYNPAGSRQGAYRIPLHGISPRQGTFQLRLRIPGRWKAVPHPLLLKDTLNPEYTEFAI
jgi:hypothetical protein